MPAYYNEFDPKAAAWLRELIKQGHIAPGDVDERSIEDVTPDDLRGYEQCHFFAGIGIWSYALRRAGWPDDRGVWTGSCPCQPFSEAGSRGGFDDKRHLWPAFFWLIRQCRPSVVFGEQVASKDGLAWLDLVHADMEGEDYAIAAVDLCAAGVGAPNRRQRLFFVADSHSERQQGWPEQDIRSIEPEQPTPRRHDTGGRSPVRALADAPGTGPLPTAYGGTGDEDASGRPRGSEPQRLRGVGDSDGAGHEIRTRFGSHDAIEVGQTERQAALEAGFVRGFWADARWIKCNDPDGPRYRPVEPRTFPLAHGYPERVGLLRGAGNAINAEAATAWIESYVEARTIDERVRLEGVFA